MVESPRTANPFRSQLGLIVIFLNNLLYNILPFFVFKNLYLRAIGIEIGRKSYIHRRVYFTYPGNLRVGNNCTINFKCFLDTRGKIDIGDNVMIGHCSKIYTVGHDIDDEFFAAVIDEVIIEDDVVVFPNVLIMPDVTLHRGCVVLPGSVVTKDVGSFEVVGGNPAQFIRYRTDQISYRLNWGRWLANA